MSSTDHEKYCEECQDFTTHIQNGSGKRIICLNCSHSSDKEEQQIEVFT